MKCIILHVQIFIATIWSANISHVQIKNVAIFFLTGCYN